MKPKSLIYPKAVPKKLKPKKPLKVLPPDELAVESSQTNLIWPTDQEIEAVSEQLALLKRSGIRLAAAGDYFKSGDLAYQLQEIIQTIAALSKQRRHVRP